MTRKKLDFRADAYRNVLGFVFRQWTHRPALVGTISLQVGDGEAMRYLALAGAGLARMTEFAVRADIAAGRLVPVLEKLNPGDLEEFYAVYIGHGGPLPARVRALLDFLAKHVRL